MEPNFSPFLQLQAINRAQNHVQKIQCRIKPKERLLLQQLIQGEYIVFGYTESENKKFNQIAIRDFSDSDFEKGAVFTLMKKVNKMLESN